MSVRIIIDSTADIAEEIKNEFTVVPLTLHFGEEEYLDRVEITDKEFYERLVESDVLPTTSQPSPYRFEQVYEEVVKAGDTAVVIVVSSKLSGTYNSASIAAEGFEGKIYVVDTFNVALGSGILAEYALKLKREGKSAEEIAAEITKERENVKLIAMLDTLEYLRKGGRISAVAGFAGGLLSIKPVITVDKGEIKMLGKARGSKQANNLLAAEIQAAGGVDFSKPLLLGYSGLSDALLQKYIKDSASLWEDNASSLRSTVMGSVIGTHAGPDAIVVAFFSKNGDKKIK